MTSPGQPLPRVRVREWPFKVQAFEGVPASVAGSGAEPPDGAPVVLHQDGRVMPSVHANGAAPTPGVLTVRAPQA